MLKNYIKIALRNIFKYKLFSFINITALSIGFAICLIMLLYVFDEYSYDNDYRDSERIYRIVTNARLPV